MVGKTSLRETTNQAKQTIGGRIRSPAAVAHLGVALLAFLAGTGMAAAAGPSAVVGALTPLMICDVPALGDFIGWFLQFFRELLIVGGPVAAVYGVSFAPVDGGRMSPGRWVLVGLVAFAVGILWVALVTYFGTDVLGGNDALINTATCGMSGA